jgi:hypothetical protein
MARVVELASLISGSDSAYIQEFIYHHRAAQRTNTRSLDLAVLQTPIHDQEQRNKPGFPSQIPQLEMGSTKATTAFESHILEHNDNLCCYSGFGLRRGFTSDQITGFHEQRRTVSESFRGTRTVTCHILVYALRLDKDEVRLGTDRCRIPSLSWLELAPDVWLWSVTNRCDETRLVVPTREPARCTFKCARVGLSGAHVRTCPARVGILRLPVVRACQSDSVCIDRLWSQRKAGTWRFV